MVVDSVALRHDFGSILPFLSISELNTVLIRFIFGFSDPANVDIFLESHRGDCFGKFVWMKVGFSDSDAVAKLNFFVVIFNFLFSLSSSMW